MAEAPVPSRAVQPFLTTARLGPTTMRMSAYRKHLPRPDKAGIYQVVDRRAAAAARMVGDLLTFGADASPYPVPSRGESIRKGWAMTGAALRRSISTFREKP